MDVALSLAERRSSQKGGLLPVEDFMRANLGPELTCCGGVRDETGGVREVAVEGMSSQASRVLCASCLALW